MMKYCGEVNLIFLTVSARGALLDKYAQSVSKKFGYVCNYAHIISTLLLLDYTAGASRSGTEKLGF